MNFLKYLTCFKTHAPVHPEHVTHSARSPLLTTLLNNFDTELAIEKCNKLLERINEHGLGADRFEQGVYKKACPYDSDPTMDQYFYDTWQIICDIQDQRSFTTIYSQLLNTLDGLERDPLTQYINQQIKKEQQEKYKSHTYDAYRDEMPAIEEKYITLAQGMSIEERASNYRTKLRMPPEPQNTTFKP